MAKGKEKRKIRKVMGAIDKESHIMDNVKKGHIHGKQNDNRKKMQ